MIPTFLISSRLGLLHRPQGQSETNTGVEEGASALITPEFAQEVNLTVQSFTYSSPDQIKPDQYYSIFAQEAANCAELISKTLTSTQAAPRSLVLGGDHSVVLAHVAAILGHTNPQKMGILMIDSHGDINLRSTSPTGNIHGMWLRPIVSQFDVEELDRLVPVKVPASQLVYIGNLDLDPAEEEFIRQNNIQVFSVSQLRTHALSVQEHLTKWFSTLDHLHVSIDIDAFDKTIAPATGIPCPAGLFPKDLHLIFEEIKKMTNWSLDVVEVNPRKAGAAQTIELGRQILNNLLSQH